MKWKLWIITEDKTMLRKQIHNPHPGEILQHHFLDELEMKAIDLSRRTGISRATLSKIINTNQRITAETDLPLCRFFGLSEGYFLGLQNDYDMLEAKRKSKVAAMLRGIRPLTEETI
ncbi:MAG: HigA family addiction module antitoxin [Parvularculales bacterium]